MFIQNKYTKVYYNIVDRARLRNLIGYSENHHIVPRCLGGSNNSDNLVRLTAREHFLCHLLLTKMSDDHRLKYAYVCMCRINKDIHIDRVTSSRWYELAKKLNSIASRARYYERLHTPNPLSVRGKRRYYDPNTGDEKFFARGDVPPVGWMRGSQKTRDILKGKFKSHVYYHNPIDGRVIHIPPTSQPPVGFIRGNLNNKNRTNPFKSLSYFHNPLTCDEVRSDVCPDGWVVGRGCVWINDGISNKLIKRIDDVPNGWKRGLLVNNPNAVQKKVDIRLNLNKRVKTPLGVFDHPLYFCELYDIWPALFDNLDGLIRLRSTHNKLKQDLIDVGYNFSKTKRENGFDFI